MKYNVYQFSDKMDIFEFLGLNLLKNRFWGQNFKNLSLYFESTFLRYYLHQFSNRTDILKFWGPNFPQNEFWDQNFKNVSLDSESASLRYYVHQFSDKMDNFEFLGLNLGQIAQLGAKFLSKYCWGCCRELGGSWSELEGGEWSWVEVKFSWVEVHGASWRCVHGLVIPVCLNHIQH